MRTNVYCLLKELKGHAGDKLKTPKVQKSS